MKTLLTSLILLHSYFAFTQIQGLGVGGGSNFANLKNPSSETYNSDTNTGFGGGLRFDFRMVDEYIMFSPEIYILQKGSDQYVSEIDQINLGQIDISYIGMNIPLTIYGPMGEESYDNYHGVLLKGSLYLDYVLNGSQRVNGEARELLFEDRSNQFEMGFSVEGGFIYEGYQLFFGYNYGLSDFKFINAFDNSDNILYSAAHKGLFVSVGYSGKLYTDFE